MNKNKEKKRDRPLGIFETRLNQPLESDLGQEFPWCSNQKGCSEYMREYGKYFL